MREPCNQPMPEIPPDSSISWPDILTKRVTVYASIFPSGPCIRATTPVRCGLGCNSKISKTKSAKTRIGGPCA
jgi:hypothetical protein